MFVHAPVAVVASSRGTGTAARRPSTVPPYARCAPRCGQNASWRWNAPPMSRHSTSSRSQYDSGDDLAGREVVGIRDLVPAERDREREPTRAMAPILEHVSILCRSRARRVACGRGPGARWRRQQGRVRGRPGAGVGAEARAGRAQRGPPARGRPPADPGAGRPDRGRARARHRRARTASTWRPTSSPAWSRSCPRAASRPPSTSATQPYYEIIVELKTSWHGTGARAVACQRGQRRWRSSWPTR